MKIHVKNVDVKEGGEIWIEDESLWSKAKSYLPQNFLDVMYLVATIVFFVAMFKNLIPIDSVFIVLFLTIFYSKIMQRINHK